MIEDIDFSDTDVRERARKYLGVEKVDDLDSMIRQTLTSMEEHYDTELSEEAKDAVVLRHYKYIVGAEMVDEDRDYPWDDTAVGWYDTLVEDYENPTSHSALSSASQALSNLQDYESIRTLIGSVFEKQYGGE
jgi:hypothetical protein